MRSDRDSPGPLGQFRPDGSGAMNRHQHIALDMDRDLLKRSLTSTLYEAEPDVETKVKFRFEASRLSGRPYLPAPCS